MNRLLEHLRRKRTVSVEALRRLYHALVLKTHPNATKRSGVEFVRLQVEYEEAMRYLKSGREHKQEKAKARHATESNPRESFLRHLYVFATTVFYGKQWHSLVSDLLRSAAAYDPQVGEIVAIYKRTWLDTVRTWKSRDLASNTHGLFVMAVRQLAFHYESGAVSTRRALLGDIAKLSEQADDLDEDMRDCIKKFSYWLKQQADGPKVSLVS